MYTFRCFRPVVFSRCSCWRFFSNLHTDKQIFASHFSPVTRITRFILSTYARLAHHFAFSNAGVLSTFRQLFTLQLEVARRQRPYLGLNTRHEEYTSMSARGFPTRRYKTVGAIQSALRRAQLCEMKLPLFVASQQPSFLTF